jgi:hypothetical protein
MNAAAQAARLQPANSFGSAPKTAPICRHPWHKRGAARQAM